MKGIVLAGGTAKRLYPVTKACGKSLLPLYDKPLVYYPLSVLLRAGIRDILIIVPAGLVTPFADLFADGSAFGVSITYLEQETPRGIAEALILGRDFIGEDRVCLVLGDNIIYGAALDLSLRQAAARQEGAVVFAYPVADPRPFGVIELDAAGRPLSLEEKPAQPRSHYIVPGIYFYDCQAPQLAASLRPSRRGELEITDLNRLYLQQGKLQAIPLDRCLGWHDAGTADSLLDAACAVRDAQRSSGKIIACLEEIAYHQGWIDTAALQRSGQMLQDAAYGRYLLQLASDREGKTGKSNICR